MIQECIIMSKNAQGIRYTRKVFHIFRRYYVLGMLKIDNFKIFKACKAFISEHASFHIHHSLHWLGLGCYIFLVKLYFLDD